MRLVAKFTDLKEAQNFSLYLVEKGVANHLEMHASESLVWAIEEDHFEEAQKYHQEFLNDPNWKPKEHLKENVKVHEAPAPLKAQNDHTPSPQEIREAHFKKYPNESLIKRYGILTLIISFVCVSLFLWSVANAPKAKGASRIQAQAISIYYSPYKYLLYEYPKAYEEMYQLFYQSIKSGNSKSYIKSQEATTLLNKIARTPFWHGYYQTFMVPNNKSYPLKTAYLKEPSFAQIKKGEVYRLITPIFLHGNFIHILFNLLWFVYLGKQIEKRIKWFKFFVFILVSALISNTAQYLMSGPNFLGISGVIMAMAGYIWQRTKKAPWEGYSVQKTVLYFLAFYVLAFFILQLISFLAELMGQSGFAPNIGNTSHIVGAIVGIIMGRFRYFTAWKMGKYKS